MSFSNCFGTYERVECGLCVIIKKDEWTSEIHPIPLVSVDVTASVVHAVSQVQVTQVFINKEEQPIEAIYYFPVDSNGAVTHFEAEIEGRKIKGIAKAHEEAKAEYEKAIGENRTAFLGEENKPDIFTVKIGYLKPGHQAKVTLGYVSEVKNEKDSKAIRFFIPTTVAPRYVPKGASKEDVKSEELRKMEFSDTSPAPLTIKVNVSIQGEIQSIDSPTHKISVTSKGPIPEKKNWTKAAIELEGKTTDMDRDFVLLITPAETNKPRLYLEELESSLAVMAHLIPSFKLDEQQAELIFVLDRSGSMQGQSIELAKKALTLFLHSLPADCYFNVVGFGSTYSLLFRKSVKYDDNTLQTATTYARDLQADMGGTEILEPLKTVYDAEPVPGYLRQIFVITDGEVSNTDEVIGLTKAKAHESRVFSLGIGDGASHYLVEGLAAAGGGTSAFVTYNEAVDKKVLQQLKDALQPSLTNVKLTWQGVPPIVTGDTASKPVEINKEKTLMGYGKPKDPETVEKSEASVTKSSPVKKAYYQAPEKIPPIFDGTQLLAFGVFKDKEVKPTGLIIQADSPDGPLTIEIQVSSENDLGGTGMIHKLAAVKIIRETELKVAALGFDRWDRQEDESLKQQEAKFKAEIIALAVEEGLASKYTSFVAVDTSSEDKAKDNWAMQTRLVPSQLAHGWHGGQPMMCSAPMPQIAMCKRSKRALIAPVASRTPPAMQFSFGGSSRSMQSQQRSVGGGLFGSSSFGSQPPPSPSTLFGSNAFGQPPPPPTRSSKMFSSPVTTGFASGNTFAFGSPRGGCTAVANTSTAPFSFGCSQPQASLFGIASDFGGASFGRNVCGSFPPPPPSSTSSMFAASATTTSIFGQSSSSFGFGRNTAGAGPVFGSAVTSTPPMMLRSGGAAPQMSNCSFGTAFGAPQVDCVLLAERDGADEDDDMGCGLIDHAEEEESPSQPTNEPTDVLHQVISFQSFDGSFKPEDGLIKVMGLDVALVKQTAETNGWDVKAWITALALAFLSQKLGDQRDSWELVAMKAQKWLGKSFPAIVEGLTSAAVQLF